MAHRCVEWDGWEEGLVESILGPEEQDEDWFRTWEDERAPPESADEAGDDDGDDDDDVSLQSPFTSTSPTLTEQVSDGEDAASKRRGSTGSQRGAKGIAKRVPAPLPVKVVAVEKEKEKILNERGDFCGGRGGELGRRLEAWLVVNGDAEGRVELPRRWEGDDAIAGGNAPT